MSIFKKKIIKSNTVEKSSIQKTDIKYEKPQICIFDMNDELKELLNRNGYSVFNGSFGKSVKVPESSPGHGYCCLLNLIRPANIHEYDIFVVNMCDTEIVDYDQKKHQREYIKEKKDVYLYCQYPQTIFDPRAFSASIMNDELLSLSRRPSIIIIFAAPYETIEYQLVEKEGENVKYTIQQKNTNYDYLPGGYHGGNNKTGKQFAIEEDVKFFRKILQTYLKGSIYRTVFTHPYDYEGSIKKYNPMFMPLVRNGNNEIVAYTEFYKKQIILVFPDIVDKNNFLKELICDLLPDYYPVVFPFSEKESWINNEEYYLPGHGQLIDEKNLIDDKYRNESINIDSRIVANKKKYNFLHGLILNTGDLLVESIIEYLNWLGFESVRNMDKILNEKKEEDLQIDLENGLLVVEIKGIVGTSKDDECSQISKIKYRRCEERGKFDVYALYIVNHQRCLPAAQRKNPPFTDVQIQDAEREKRGLLTTWQLFNIYYEIEDGVFEKNVVKKQLIQYGLIDFYKDIFCIIGKVFEIFKDGFVGIVRIEAVNIKKGDLVYYYLENRHTMNRIKTIHVNDKEVDSANNGEIGLQFEKKIRNNIILKMKRS